MKIPEENDYIRNEQGIILKIKSIKPYMQQGFEIEFYKRENSAILYLEDYKKVKFSKNLIDLIEVGDIVNGNYVFENNKSFLKLIDVDCLELFVIKNEHIKMILTKEQIKQRCYRVEDENNG